MTLQFQRISETYRTTHRIIKSYNYTKDFAIYSIHWLQEINFDYSSHVDVNNIEFNGGGPGLDFSGDPGSSGSVVNSRFISSGVLIQGTKGEIRIANNVFCESGIQADAKYYGGIRGLIIEDNDINDSGLGILFYGTIESRISNNIITNNEAMGITLQANMDCGRPGFDCFYSTGNVITDNVVLGNGIDLHHCEECIGNTWQRNTYETNQGVETYTANPTTAREALDAISSAAAAVAADAQLMHVSSLSCDTNGKSFTWIYIYKSDI